MHAVANPYSSVMESFGHTYILAPPPAIILFSGNATSVVIFPQVPSLGLLVEFLVPIAPQTPLSRLLCGKLRVAQLVKKFPNFYGTRSFITVFTRACHWTLS
jgi:hypothetical protein